LKNVNNKKVDSDDVKVYYLSKDGTESVFEYQRINNKGQIEGGLKNFYETELADLSSFFKIID
jgi:predicted DNA-binding WGR domain protein